MIRSQQVAYGEIAASSSLLIQELFASNPDGLKLNTKYRCISEKDGNKVALITKLFIKNFENEVLLKFFKPLSERKKTSFLEYISKRFSIEGTPDDPSKFPITSELFSNDEKIAEVIQKPRFYLRIEQEIHPLRIIEKKTEVEKKPEPLETPHFYDCKNCRYLFSSEIQKGFFGQRDAHHNISRETVIELITKKHKNFNKKIKNNEEKERYFSSLLVDSNKQVIVLIVDYFPQNRTEGLRTFHVKTAYLPMQNYLEREFGLTPVRLAHAIAQKQIAQIKNPIQIARSQ